MVRCSTHKLQISVEVVSKKKHRCPIHHMLAGEAAFVPVEGVSCEAYREVAMQLASQKPQTTATGSNCEIAYAASAKLSEPERQFHGMSSSQREAGQSRAIFSATSAI